MARLFLRAPWIRVAYWVARFGYRAWQRLTPPERDRLWSLLVKSKGRRINLSDSERDELRALTRKARGRKPKPR